jgi:hypothetical protein
MLLKDFQLIVKFSLNEFTISLGEQGFSSNNKVNYQQEVHGICNLIQAKSQHKFILHIVSQDYIGWLDAENLCQPVGVLAGSYWIE